MTSVSAKTERVAIVIPAWNSEGTIARAVRSALRQSEPCHVIVVDDASTDSTAAAAETAGDELDEPIKGRLTVLRMAQNGGPAVARNAGIDIADAQWIALLDSDDFMEPGRIAGVLSVAAAAKAGSWDLIADDLLRIAEGEPRETARRLIAQDDFAPFTLSFEDFVTGNLHGARGARGELGFLKPLMNKAFLDKHRLRYDPGVRLGEDYDLYARALAQGGRMFVTNPLGYYAVARADSISGRHGAADLAGIVRADKSLLTLQSLSPQERRAVRLHLAAVRREWAWLRLIEAVKARAPGEALASFMGPPDVALSLCARLAEQVVVRMRRRFTGSGR